MEEKYVMEEEWDYLIILDACRYDFFESIYKEFFGYDNLEKAISPAIETIEWAEKSFKDFYEDIIYISTTPFINSKKGLSERGFYFNAKKHFYKVIDLWDWGWDHKIGTVRPEKVNEIALKEYQLHPDKRLIIHYMQPHAPYLSLEKLYMKLRRGDKRGKERGIVFQRNLIPSSVRRILAEICIKGFGTEFVWRLNKIFHFRKIHPLHMEMAWRMVGREGIIKAYADNLRIVLKYVQKLVETLNGKIIITSDHGEMLGEDGFYGHGYPLPRHPKLVEVPWFVINKGQNIHNDERSRIKKGLRALRERGKL